MIESIFRKIYPTFDGSFIENVRLSNDPAVREAILWEYGLGPLLPFATDPKMIDAEVGEFIRFRGTLASIRTALKWVGFPNISFTRLSRVEYEVDPGRIPTDRELSAISAALAVSIQSRGILRRIYNGTFEVKYG